MVLCDVYVEYTVVWWLLQEMGLYTVNGLWYGMQRH